MLVSLPKFSQPDSIKTIARSAFADSIDSIDQLTTFARDNFGEIVKLCRLV